MRSIPGYKVLKTGLMILEPEVFTFGLQLNLPTTNIRGTKFVFYEIDFVEKSTDYLHFVSYKIHT